MPPVITLLGDIGVSVLQGNAYTDLGATALDNKDSYIVVGSAVLSDGDLTGLNKVLSDSIIVKYDTNGNVV